MAESLRSVDQLQPCQSGYFSEFYGTPDSSRGTLDRFSHPRLQELLHSFYFKHRWRHGFLKAGISSKVQRAAVVSPQVMPGFLGTTFWPGIGLGGQVTLGSVERVRITTGSFICSFLIVFPPFFVIRNGSFSSGGGGGDNLREAQSMARAWLPRREQRKRGSKWTEACREEELCYTLDYRD